MATNRDLLTEAIADAKAVKETAIANAKLALEEAFTPFLKDQLSAKLSEMDKDDEKEVKEEKEEVEEMDAVSWNEKNNPTRSSSVGERDPKKVGQATPKYAINVNEEEIDEEINLDELLAELDEIDEAKKHDSKKGNKEEQKRMEGAIRDDRDHIKDLEKDIKDNEKKLAKLKADEPKDVNESEETLDEVEVKEEKEKEDDSKKKMEESEISEDARTDAEEEGYLDGMKDEKEDMEDRMDDEEIDLEDMSEDDLKGFIEDVIKDMVSAGEIEPGDEFVEDEIEVEDVEDVDVDVEIDEAKEIEEGEEVNEAEENLDEMSKKEKREGDMRKPFKDRSKAQKMTLDMSRDGESDSEMKEELEAAIAQVNELKAELNEVNLLNAKLLYTNKIFKAKNLNESKKVKVLKAFDKAKDVAQAKTIYETLNEGLLDKSSINENRIKGSASKATGLEPKNSKQPIIESNDVYNRMRQLAGLL